MGTTWRVRNGNRKVIGGSGRVVPTTEELKESRSRTSSRASPSLGISASQPPPKKLPQSFSTSDPKGRRLADGVKYIAPEIVVWTDATDADAMSVDSPQSLSPATELEPEPEPEQELELEAEIKTEVKSEHAAYVHPMTPRPSALSCQLPPVKLTEGQLTPTSTVTRTTGNTRSPTVVATLYLTTNHNSYCTSNPCNCAVVLWLVPLGYVGAFRLVIPPRIPVEQGYHSCRCRQL
jgi:hypothetical protein